MVFIFPEFQQLIDVHLLNRKIELIKVLIEFTKGEPLSRELITQLKPKIAAKSQIDQIIAGGQSILFAWEYQQQNAKIPKIIIKPYHRNNIGQLVAHAISSNLFNQKFKNTKFVGGEKFNFEAFVRPTYVIGFEIIHYGNKSFPTLIQEGAQGVPLEELRSPTIIGAVGKIVTTCSREGFTMDVFLKNWFYEKEKELLYYVDLLFASNLSDYREQIEELTRLIIEKSSF